MTTQPTLMANKIGALPEVANCIILYIDEDKPNRKIYIKKLEWDLCETWVRLVWDFDCLHFAQYILIYPHDNDCKQTWCKKIDCLISSSGLARACGIDSPRQAIQLQMAFLETTNELRKIKYLFRSYKSKYNGYLFTVGSFVIDWDLICQCSSDN